MPAALPIVYTRIQDLTDAPSLGAGQDGYALTWDDSAGEFVATELAAGVSIDDGTTSASSVWSSSKTNTEISSVSSSLTSHTSDATIHRVINDSSTATTVLWSASKINTELAAKGSGDFLADGSVAMTGDLNLADNIVTSDDGDTEHILGRAAIGHVSASWNDYAGFAHRDRMSTAEFALMQSQVGFTYLNAAATRSIYFCENSTIYAEMTASNFDFKALEITSTDGDTTHTLGRAVVGDVGFSDHAGFAHRDYATVTDYAMRQTSAGDTIFNCATGGAVQIRVGHVNKFLLNSSVFNVLDTPINSTDDDIAYSFGRASIGYDGTNSGAAAFAHRDQMNSTDYAVRQNAVGASFVNAVTGQSISLRINNSEVANVGASSLALASGITLTSTDGDTVHTLGRAAIGYNGSNSDVAIFSHRDHATAAAAGFRQESDGDAVMNAPTGQTLQFKINNSDVVRVNSSGHLGIGTTSVDTNLHVEASTASGTITTETEAVAVFERNGDAGIQFKAPNDSEMFVYFGTPTAADNGNISYDAAVPEIKFQIGTTYGYRFGQSSFTHNTDNIASNGTGSFRWTTVYATTGTINTSDADDKDEIFDNALGLNFIRLQQTKSWRWKEEKQLDGDRIKITPKKDRRKHHGLVAQQVKASLDTLGINEKDFAGYVVMDDGKLGLRYTEFIAPLIKSVQELDNRLDANEALAEHIAPLLTAIDSINARLDALEVL